MAKSEHIFKIWKGTRAQYNAKGENLDTWTRYIVTETDGRIVEYFGTIPVVPVTGQLFPVLSVVSALPSTLNVGDRYLVGHDATDSADAEYYIVEIAANLSQSTVSPLGSHSVRVTDRDSMEYQLVDGELITYDGDLDGGYY